MYCDIDCVSGFNERTEHVWEIFSLQTHFYSTVDLKYSIQVTII